ncbi:MAG: MarR family winged helix-turn-helix transcriptional regulator [Mycobacteriaceae bacterium]|uniref:MarR family winged helix-turn-helix transcriptional regulator n=1 Tax=Corynebacterium sp. TaxID=1720 RepID=UPI003F9D0DFD
MNDSTENTFDTPDLTNQLMHLAMMLRRTDMVGHPGRPFGGTRAGQGRVLHILTLQSPMSQKELAYMLGVRPQSLSELLGKLESSGYVERKRDEGDRRTFIVEITDEGRTAAADTPETDDPFDVLADGEQEKLAEMLERVTVAVREKLPERPRGRDVGGHGGHGHHGPHSHGEEPHGGMGTAFFRRDSWGFGRFGGPHPHFA